MANEYDVTPFHFNEGTLQLPVQWKDISVIVLSAAEDDKSGISFTISRDTLPWGLTFIQFAENEIESIAHQLKEYKEISRETGKLQRRDTVTSEFSWVSPQGAIHQLMMILDLAPKTLIFTATVPGVMDARQRKMLNGFMHTLVLRETPTNA